MISIVSVDLPIPFGSSLWRTSVPLPRETRHLLPLHVLAGESVRMDSSDL